MTKIITKELYVESTILASVNSVNFAIYETYLHIYIETYFDDMYRIIFPNVQLLKNYDIDKVLEAISNKLFSTYCPYLENIIYKTYIDFDDTDREYFTDFTSCIIQKSKIIKSNDNIYSFLCFK
jgi:hypothetical protein